MPLKSPKFVLLSYLEQLQCAMDVAALRSLYVVDDIAACQQNK